MGLDPQLSSGEAPGFAGRLDLFIPFAVSENIQKYKIRPALLIYIFF